MRIRQVRFLSTLLAAALVAPLGAVSRAVAQQQQQQAQTQAQRRGVGIDTYAITNARIVTVSGAPVERGTVVIRDGLIAAVGPSVAPPPDARLIDGAGLTVYPGIIDANTALGIPRPTPSPGGGGGGFGLFGQTLASASAPNSTQPPGLQPELLASDILRPGGGEVEASRNAGITAALTAPRGNVFLGQSAFINLSGDTPQQMIVRTPVALHVGLNPIGGGQYPGSLMGVYTTIRQMLLDAQRYRESEEIYARSPRGLRRPEVDKSLAALQPVLARQMPVIMQADREREITRALEIAREFNLRLIISGGMEADKVAGALKAANVPVLLSLNFPRRITAPAPEADPEPVRILRERVEAPKTAARLAAAGVPFAFQSGGMSAMTDYLANAARAVEQGLSRDEAVRAMTLRAAELLGVSDRLGSIEQGKIANLTVTRGDLFARDRRITHVFIDGQPFEPRAAATTTGAANATGVWTLRVNTGGQAGEPEVTVTLNLQQQGDRLSGSLQGPLGTGQIAGSITGGEIRFTVPVTLSGPVSQTTDANFAGTITGNQMSGTVTIVGRGAGTFTGTRAGGPAPTGTGGGTTTTTPPASSAAPANVGGTWSIVVRLDNAREVPATLTLSQQGASFSGAMESEFGSSQISNGTVTGARFRFQTQINIGQSVDVTFEGTVTGNQMSGTVSTPTGGATFTGTRNP